jgi:hypothetical protein
MKSQLLSRKTLTTSQELITSSTNFTSSSASSEIFEKNERLSKDLNHKSSKNNLALNSATSFSNSNYKSITSIDKLGNRRTSGSPSNDSNEKSQGWTNNKDQINSTTSLITNLFENNEENFDLFGNNAFASNSKSLIESPLPNEIPNNVIIKQSELNYKSSDSEHIKKEPLKLSSEISSKLDTIPKKNIVIYDNNLLEQNGENNETKEDFKKIRQKFHTQLSVQLLTRRAEENSKSKSCERIDKIDDDPEKIITDDLKRDFLININTNNNKSNDLEINTSADKEAIVTIAKRLSYSKSLKLTQKNSPFVPKNDLNLHKINTKETYSTRIIDGNIKIKDNNQFLSKIPNEPTWKELAFKKQNAWYKNFEF